MAKTPRLRPGKRQRANLHKKFPGAAIQEADIIRVKWTGTVQRMIGGQSYLVVYKDGDSETMEETELLKHTTLGSQPKKWIGTTIRKYFPYKMVAVNGAVGTAESCSQLAADRIRFRLNALNRNALDSDDLIVD
jgi:hypothetical protein